MEQQLPQQHSTHLLLTEEEIADPLLVFQKIFDCYHLQELKSMLQDLLKVGLTTENNTYNTERSQTDLQFFHENMERLAEAAYLLKEKKDQ